MKSSCEQFCKYALMSPPEKALLLTNMMNILKKKNFFLKNFEHLKIKKNSLFEM